MKKNKFYSAAKLGILFFSFCFLLSACDSEPNPEITNLQVCDTKFSDHMGCDSHHSTISISAASITAAITADDLEETNSYEFNIFRNENGEKTLVASSGKGLISAIIGDEFRSNGLVLGYSWELTAGNTWTPGSYTMEARVDTSPELVRNVNYVVE